MDVKATAGLVARCSRSCRTRDEAVTHLAIAFDNPIVRSATTSSTATRPTRASIPTLRAQFDLAEDAVRALGIVVWSMDRWEADDALATARDALRGTASSRCASSRPTRTSGSACTATRVVQVDRIRRKVIDEAAMRARARRRAGEHPGFARARRRHRRRHPRASPASARSRRPRCSRATGTIEAIPDDATQWDVKVRGAPRLAATLARAARGRAPLQEARDARDGRPAARVARRSRVPRRAARVVRGRSATQLGSS